MHMPMRGGNVLRYPPSLAALSIVITCGGLIRPYPAAAQQPWARFTDQTATRLVADAAVGSANTDEKDYAWGDVDLDGDLDLVAVHKQPFTTTGRRRNVLFLNESGILVDRTLEYGSASAVLLDDGSASQGLLDLTNDRDVQLVDLNGDGWLDIITSTTLSGPFGKAISHPRVYINRGDDPPGSGAWQGFLFDDEDRIPTMPAEPRFNAVAAGDVDNDGDVDLYFVDSQWGGARPVDLNDRLLINTGNGYFLDESAARMTPIMLESSFGGSCWMVDMNGDGVRDIVKVDRLNAPQGISIAYNQPANPGYFSGYEMLPSYAWAEVTPADLNNDNRLDLAASDEGLDRFLLNLGNGADGRADFSINPYAWQVGNDDGFAGETRAEDLDHDGFRDVLISDVDEDIPGCTRRMHIFRNLGNVPAVTLREEQANSRVCNIPTSQLTGTHDVAVFDIDGDGWHDLVIGRCTGMRIWMNVTPHTACGCFADVNADGARNGLDLAGFVDCYLAGGGPGCACADANWDALVDPADVAPFVSALLAGAACN